jgi:hypothetical protein
MPQAGVAAGPLDVRFGAQPPVLKTQAIETIKVGQRVLAKNPEVSSFERRTRGPEPNFERWLHLTLEMPKRDGSNRTINMLWSEEWLRNQIGLVVAENSAPSGERLGLSKCPPCNSRMSRLPGAIFAAGEPQCRAVVPTALPRNQGVNDWDNGFTEVAAVEEKGGRSLLLRPWIF